MKRATRMPFETGHGNLDGRAAGDDRDWLTGQLRAEPDWSKIDTMPFLRGMLSYFSNQFMAILKGRKSAASANAEEPKVHQQV